MFQKILIGYDGAERGGEATALAETLRDPHTGTLVLTCIYPPAPLPVGGYVGPEDVERLREEAEERLLVARDTLPDRDRVMIRAIPSDSAARVLTEVAEAEQADLVVVGSSRRSTLGRLLPGTTAERLLHEAPCPVAVAPRGYSGGDIRRVGVAYDGSPEADAALRAAESFALERSAALTVYCVVEAPSHVVTERTRDLLQGVVDNAPPGIRPEWLVVTACPRQRSQAEPTAWSTCSSSARAATGRSPCAPRQRLRRARARGGLPRRGDPAHGGRCRVVCRPPPRR